MKIRIETIRKKREGSRLLGIVDVILNDIIIIEDINIIQGPKSRFIAMPSKFINDTFFDFAHPTNLEMKEELTNAVLDAFDGKGSCFGEIDNLEITDVRINYTSNATGVIATAELLINNRFAFHDILIVKELTEDGNSMIKCLFPTRKYGEVNRRYIYYSINREFTDKLFKTILDKYKEGLK